jgi:hypothetical protein
MKIFFLFKRFFEHFLLAPNFLSALLFEAVYFSHTVLACSSLIRKSPASQAESYHIFKLRCSSGVEISTCVCKDSCVLHTFVVCAFRQKEMYARYRCFQFLHEGMEH